MAGAEYIPPVIEAVILSPPARICITSGGEDESGTRIPGFTEEEW